jgi:hypothetical protein
MSNGKEFLGVNPDIEVVSKKCAQRRATVVLFWGTAVVWVWGGQ